MRRRKVIGRFEAERLGEWIDRFIDEAVRLMFIEPGKWPQSGAVGVL